MAKQPASQSEIKLFLESLLEANPLIRPYLHELVPDPFFLIASTGLGKTIVVPTFSLVQALAKNPDAAPRVWVVEPKIAIAQGLHAELNRRWDEFRRSHGIDAGPLFGCKTKVDHRDMDAPIVFVTTGIFGIYGLNGKFRKGIDRVLIDESHATLEGDPMVEFAMAFSRMNGVRVDFMSASVEESCLKALPGIRVVRAQAKRHPLMLLPTHRPMKECIRDIVYMTLIDPGRFLSRYGHIELGSLIAKTLAESGRARGVLIVVNSYADKNSEAQQILKLLRTSPFASQIETGLLAGETLRDAKKRSEFEANIKRWVREKKKYVLVATSVVEMGVTLPELDVIITSDEGLETDENGRLERGPININSLIQRLGRSARQRPGLGVITNDAGAYF